MLEFTDISQGFSSADRLYLKDPNELSYIDSIFVSLESELIECNEEVSMFDIEVSKYANTILGLENKFSEAVRSAYYKVKARIKQLIKFFFGTMMNWLKGGVDVKAVIGKYKDKIRKYKKAFDDKNFEGDRGSKEMEVRDTIAGISKSIALFLCLTKLINNYCDSLAEMSNEGITSGYILASAVYVQSVSALFKALLNMDNWVSILPNITPETNIAQSLFANEKINLPQYQTGANTDAGKVNLDSKIFKVKFSSDDLRGIKEDLNEFKPETKTEELAKLKTEFGGNLKYLDSILSSKVNDWDFKKAANKLEKIRNKVEKELNKKSNNTRDEFKKQVEGKKSGGNESYLIPEIYGVEAEPNFVSGGIDEKKDMNKPEKGLWSTMDSSKGNSEAMKKQSEYQEKHTPKNSKQEDKTKSSSSSEEAWLNNITTDDGKMSPEKTLVKIMQVVTDIGASTSNISAGISETIKDFKSNMEIFITECTKIGSEMYKK